MSATVEMTIACGQFASQPGQAERSLGLMEDMAGQAAAQGAGLAVFPELCLTGYPSDPEAAARSALDVGSPEIARLRATALRLRIALCFGFTERLEAGELANSMAFVGADGTVRGVYRKVHLWVTEKAWARPGSRFECVEEAGVRWGMWLCYDTRFPETARSLSLDGATAGLVGSAWFGPVEEWELALRSRALDNGMFVAGAALQGAVGPNALRGASLIADPHGTVIARATEGHDELITARYDARAIDSFRARLPLLRDRRPDAYMRSEGRGLPRPEGRPE